MKSFAIVCYLALLGVVYGAYDPVYFDVYYESYCPYSRDFISNQLDPTFRLVPEIMSVRAYPYGNAHETFDGNAYAYTCQHGPAECQGNVIQSCGLGIYQDQATWIPWLGCTETPSNVTEPNVAASQCAIERGLDWQLINTCVGSTEGNALQHKNAMATDALNPTHEYVPWIVTNGVHDVTYENIATMDLLSLVCALTMGDIPPGCSAAVPLSQIDTSKVRGRTVV